MKIFRINAYWHKMHPMPKNPTMEQRIAWHEAHVKGCGCAKMPRKLAYLIRKRDQ